MDDLDILILNNLDPQDRQRISVIDLYSGRDIETLKKVIITEQHLIDTGQSTEHALFYTEDAIYNACSLGKVDILRFWIESGLELKYNDCALIDCFNGENDIDIVRLWLEAELKINNFENFLTEILDQNRLDILRVILDFYPDIKFTPAIMESMCSDEIDEAIADGKPNVLNFLFQY